jgi:hypothetical protein
MKTKSYMRYHRYDQNNVKYIKRFELNESVPITTDPNFTQWIRGTGPHSPEALLNVTEGLRKACLGVPKAPETREKMRLAKLGVPKSQEHKDNMRKSWYRRKELEMSERYIVDEIQSTSTTPTAQYIQE